MVHGFDIRGVIKLTIEKFPGIRLLSMIVYTNDKLLYNNLKK